MQWMIYGANGYTGELIAREAVRQGLSPVLAGRSVDKVEALARSLGLTSRIFSLDGPVSQTASHLSGMSLVLHCAGPFSATSAPMIEACLAAACHYLDISGEIGVFEHAHDKVQSSRARQKGVVICPGVGFDVIPTDCVALKLKTLMPDAQRLCLGFDTDTGLSRGTLKTVVEGMSSGCMVRQQGRIVEKPLGFRKRRIDFGRGSRWSMTIPWGDVSTAWYTTAIPDIDTWIPMPRFVIEISKLSNILRPILSMLVLQSALKSLLDRFVHGPDEGARQTTPTFVWGEASNAAGKQISVRIRTANIYSVTVTGALAVVRHLLTPDHAGGSFTPATLMGAGLIETLPGSGKFEIS